MLSEVVLLEIMKRLQPKLNFAIKRKSIDLKFKTQGIISQSCIFIDKQLIDRLLYSILFTIIRSSKTSDKILCHSFEASAQIEKYPDYKIAIANNILNMNVFLDDKFIIAVQAPWLKDSPAELLDFMYHSDLMLRKHDGRAYFDTQTAEINPEEDHKDESLNPVILFLLPFKQGKWITYRDWAQDSVNEQAIILVIPERSPKENTLATIKM
jgi:hypothetical protein